MDIPAPYSYWEEEYPTLGNVFPSVIEPADKSWQLQKASGGYTLALMKNSRIEMQLVYQVPPYLSGIELHLPPFAPISLNVELTMPGMTQEEWNKIFVGG